MDQTDHFDKLITKANLERQAEIPATISCHLQLHALITYNSGQNFAAESAVFPV